MPAGSPPIGARCCVCPVPPVRRRSEPDVAFVRWHRTTLALYKGWRPKGPSPEGARPRNGAFAARRGPNRRLNPPFRPPFRPREDSNVRMWSILSGTAGHQHDPVVAGQCRRAATPQRPANVVNRRSFFRIGVPAPASRPGLVVSGIYTRLPGVNDAKRCDSSPVTRLMSGLTEDSVAGGWG
jgi:hypothetical protein